MSYTNLIKICYLDYGEYKSTLQMLEEAKESNYEVSYLYFHYCIVTSILIF